MLGSCNDEMVSNPRRPESGMATTTDDDDDDDDDDKNDNNDDEADVWASSEGYTPLANLHGNNPFGEAVMVSLGPGESSDDDDSHHDDEARQTSAAAFFVNPSAFSGASDDQDDSSCSESNEPQEIVNHINYAKLPVNYSHNSELDGILPGGEKSSLDLNTMDDFQSITDKLLGALDDDYERTLRGQTTDPPSSDTNASATKPIFEQEDLKLFATAFDNRHDHTEEDGSNTFDVDWDTATASTTKPTANVDISAVNRAVSTLKRRSNCSFQQKFSNWNQYQFHSIIPVASLKAFRRSTPKAMAATAQLSRAATAAEAISRIIGLDLDSKELRIHILGVDHVECESPERIQALFRPLVTWLARWKTDLVKIELVLIGRDLNVATCSKPVPLASPTTNSSNIISLKEAVATCYNGVYHEWLAENPEQNNPHMMIAYNAGIWGYIEWKSTIEFLDTREVGTPLVITAYTLPECSEDYGVFEEIVPVYKCIWGPQENPFGSKTQAPHSSNQEYRENAAWQAWNLGIKQNTET
jgi:hypothetical protein